MASPHDAIPHFRCSFDLCAPDGKPLPWEQVVRTARNWMRRRIERWYGGVDVAFGKSWMFAGGDWRSLDNPRVRAWTRRENGAGTLQDPQYWALRFEHPDSDEIFRQWVTDFGVTVLDPARIRVAVTVAHFLRDGFIGTEPGTPVPSAPRLVPDILRNREWVAYAGDQALTSTAQILVAGNGHEFARRLYSSERRCPLILISREFGSGELLLNANRLAQLVAGAAVVFEAENSDVDKELEHLLDNDHRCWNGMVRIYQPDVRPGDRTRHRFFRREQIQAAGAEEIEAQIVRGLVRRRQLLLQGAVAAIEDVADQTRSVRLLTLRDAAVKGQETSQYNQLLEEELQRLEQQNEQLKARVDGLEEEIRSSEDELDSLREENGQEIASLKYALAATENKANEAEIRAYSLEVRAAEWQDFELPRAIVDVVRLAARLFPDRLVFLESAYVSAKKATLKDPSIAWQHLRTMAYVLYDLYAHGEGEALIHRDFKEQTGLDIVLKESESTSNSKYLASLREAEYNGRKLDCSAHLRHGRKPGHLLRIYYGVFSQGESLRLVIKHCGDHLDTTGTN